MAKEKVQKGQPSAPNKHLYSRLSYLYQAASYLAVASASSDPSTAKEPTKEPSTAASRSLLRQMRSISRKGQIRLSRDIKRTVCKSCDSLLIPGRSATVEVENTSVEASKPWADVFVIKCSTCGYTKRFPVLREYGKPLKTKGSDQEKEGDIVQAEGSHIVSNG
jgi:ribonuclease P protein subunit RPR2